MFVIVGFFLTRCQEQEKDKTQGEVNPNKALFEVNNSGYQLHLKMEED